MEVKVTTSPNWDDAAWRLMRFDAADLRKEYGKEVRQATKPAPGLVRKAVPVHLPSGYAPVLSGALRFSSKPIPGGVRLGATAKGKSHPRQVDNLDAGRLRAPSYPKGRRSSWPWHVQAVRPGFFTKTISGMEPDIRDAIQRAMRRIADQITGG